jgi:hypothetical protein
VVNFIIDILVNKLPHQWLQPRLGQKWGGPDHPILAKASHPRFSSSFFFFFSIFIFEEKKSNGQNDVVLDWVSVIVLKSVKSKISIFFCTEVAK